MERTALTPFLTTSTSNPISALAWLNAQQFVTGGSEVVRVWRIDTIAEKARDPSKPPPPPKYLLKESFSGEHVLGVYSLAVQDGGELFCSAGLGDVILWRRDGCKRLATLRCGHLEALGLSWRPGDALLAGGSHAGGVNLFRVEEEEEGTFTLALAHTLRGDCRAAALATAFSPDGTRCAAGHGDGSVTVFDVAARAVAARLAPAGAALPLRALAFFGGGGARLVTGGDDARVSLRWAAGGGGEGEGGGGGGEGGGAARLSAHSGFICCVAADAAGALLASASADRTVLLWDPRRRGPVAAIEGVHGDKVNAVAFSADGALLACASEAGTLCVTRMPPV